MKLHILGLLVAVLVIACVSPAYAGSRHAVNMFANYPTYSTTDIQTLAQELQGTGVNWVRLNVIWQWAEPNAPTSDPQGPDSYFGPTVQAWHNYSTLAVLDQVVSEMRARNIQMLINLDHHPGWAGGLSYNCLPPQADCGIIYNTHKQIFRDNWHDFAYNIASRYPDIVYWTLWNEPNTAGEFSPQDPINPTGIGSEYMDDIQFPGYFAIKAVIPAAIMVGPDLHTADDGYDRTEYDFWGHGLSWFTWTDGFLRYAPQYFDVFSIHTYGIDERGQLQAVSNVWNIMVNLGRQRQIWMTEFNFRRGTCDSSETDLVTWTRHHYLYMAHQRSFYFELGADGGCAPPFDRAYGLLGPGMQEKSILYPGFRQIVSEIP